MTYSDDFRISDACHGVTVSNRMVFIDETLIEMLTLTFSANRKNYSND